MPDQRWVTRACVIVGSLPPSSPTKSMPDAPSHREARRLPKTKAHKNIELVPFSLSSLRVSTQSASSAIHTNPAEATANSTGNGACSSRQRHAVPGTACAWTKLNLAVIPYHVLQVEHTSSAAHALGGAVTRPDGSSSLANARIASAKQH